MAVKRSYKPDFKAERKAKRNAQIRKVHPRLTRDVVWRDRICLMCGGHAQSGHHVLRKGSPYHGDDMPENIVPLCGDGTRGCHGLIEANDKTARKLLGIKLVEHRRDVIDYILLKLGEGKGTDWLRRRLFVELSEQ